MISSSCCNVSIANGRILAGFVVATLVSASGCQRRSTPPPPPPPTVTVAHPVRHDVVEWDEYTGRLEAVEFVEVRARVGGLVTSTPFQEGALVQQGDVLVTIDARPFQAELNARIAAEAEAAAQVRLADIDFQRISAIPGTARSATEFDRAAAVLEEAKALQAGAQAMIDAARLNVDWCEVKAPISGRVSRKFVTEGNLISGGTGQSTLLTTITSIDPIYCYVAADERSILKYAELARAGRRVSARQAQIPCVLQLADETGFPHQGKVDFVDNRVDPQTGTIPGRGSFPNPDGWLLPGFFARVRIPGSGRYEAILVPDSAVVTDQSAKMLLTVDDKNVVRPRPVRLGALFGDLRAIESGIDVNDRVIINGLMIARPGAPVKTVAGEISLASLPQGMNQLIEPPPEMPTSLPMPDEPDPPATTPSTTSQPAARAEGEQA